MNKGSDYCEIRNAFACDVGVNQRLSRVESGLGKTVEDLGVDKCPLV